MNTHCTYLQDYERKALIISFVVMSPPIACGNGNFCCFTLFTLLNLCSKVLFGTNVSTQVVLATPEGNYAFKNDENMYVRNALYRVRPHCGVRMDIRPLSYAQT